MVSREDLTGEHSPTHWLDQHVGKRYRDCTRDNFIISRPEQQQAVEACSEYVHNFPKHNVEGRSLVLYGPKGTGKDHLLVAVLRSIATRLNRAGAVVYRDGLSLFAEFRQAISDPTVSEERLIERFARRPMLLAISDPLPPSGSLSEFEQRTLLRVIDYRYRNCLPCAATLNVASRSELETRMGAQAADRLCDDAVMIPCNWPSYRQEKRYNEPQKP